MLFGIDRGDQNEHEACDRDKADQRTEDGAFDLSVLPCPYGAGKEKCSASSEEKEKEDQETDAAGCFTKGMAKSCFVGALFHRKTASLTPRAVFLP